MNRIDQSVRAGAGSAPGLLARPAVLILLLLYLFIAIRPAQGQQAGEEKPVRTRPAQGQQAGKEKRVRSGEALAVAIERNPDLKAALLDLRRAGQEVRAERGLYPFVLQLDGGYTHDSSPSLVQAGGVSHRSSDTAAAGAELSKSLPLGTQAALRLDGNRSVTTGPSWDPNSEQRLGPGYGLSTQLSVTQPLLRGAGTTVGEASLRQALKAENTARRKALRTTSEIVQQVLTTYWDLWYAERALQIDDKAMQLARSQLDEITARVEAGDAAEVDVLPYQTRLASLQEAVVVARAERRRLGIELGRLVGAPELGGRLIADDTERPPVPERDPATDAAVRAAVARCPEVLEQAAALELSREQALVAGEELRPRLDLQAWLRVRTLGDNELGPLFDQFGQSEAYSAYFGAVYELPIDDTRKQAKRASANLEVQLDEQKLVAARDRVASEVRAAIERQFSARERLELAQQTLQAAERQAVAERERQALGASIYVQVMEAEEAVREAGLRVERARVDLVQADIALRHLTGDLAARHAFPTNMSSPGR